MKTTGEIPRNIILLSELAARRARDEALKKELKPPLARRFLSKYLDHPVLRPLLELEINGSTSYEGALVLFGQELVKTTKFRCRSAALRGVNCEALEISSLGWAMLAAEQEGLEDNRWMQGLRAAIAHYACLDRGAGICMARAALETALEIPDPDILQRVVFLHSGMRQFANHPSQAQPIDDNLRSEHSFWWSIDGEKRKGVAVIDLAQDS